MSQFHWRRISPSFKPTNFGAVFLDRDGVIIKDTGYIDSPERVELCETATEAIKKLNDAGIPVVVVTNQSGIGRGFYDWNTFAKITDKIEVLLSNGGARIDATYACGALPESEDSWRKPNPGMIHAAAKDMNLSLENAYIIGDRMSDLDAGKNADIKGGIFIGEEAQLKNDFLLGSAKNFSDALNILEL